MESKDDLIVLKTFHINNAEETWLLMVRISSHIHVYLHYRRFTVDKIFSWNHLVPVYSTWTVK